MKYNEFSIINTIWKYLLVYIVLTIAQYMFELLQAIYKTKIKIKCRQTSRFAFYLAICTHSKRCL